MSDLRFLTTSQLQCELGTRLRSLRLAHNFDQRTTAEKAGVSERALRNLESGRGSTVETLVRVNAPRMQPILSKLFQILPIEKAIKAWDQALSEIFAFAHFESLGILHSIGWPSDFPGQDAPFDFAINVEGNIVAGDIKPANGSGYRLLEQELRRCISEQAAQSGMADPRVTIRYHGPLTQESVGANLRQFVVDLKQRIANRPLSEPRTFTLTIGSAMLSVILGDTKQLGGGITGTSVLSDVLAPTFKSHIEGKGRHGSKYDIRFVLSYVRLPRRGSADIKNHASFGDTIAKAIKEIGSPTSDWLGTVFLSPGTQNTEPRFFESSTANWPTGLSAKTLSHCLGAMLTPVPCFLEDIHEGQQRFSLSYIPRRDDADGD
jgi:transcriptional regulator with XRE-family HTH domain